MPDALALLLALVCFLIGGGILLQGRRRRPPRPPSATGNDPPPVAEPRPEGGGLAKEPVPTPPAGRDAPPGGVIVNEHVRIDLGPAGIAVERPLRLLNEVVWERDERLGLPWEAVRDMDFVTDRHDPKVALYVWTVDGDRRHVVDAVHLTEAECRRLAELVDRLTGGRVTLDPERRSDPRSPGPDW